MYDFAAILQKYHSGTCETRQDKQKQAKWRQDKREYQCEIFLPRCYKYVSRRLKFYFRRQFFHSFSPYFNSLILSSGREEDIPCLNCLYHTYEYGMQWCDVIWYITKKRIDTTPFPFPLFPPPFSLLTFSICIHLIYWYSPLYLSLSWSSTCNCLEVW